MNLTSINTQTVEENCKNKNNTKKKKERNKKKLKKKKKERKKKIKDKGNQHCVRQTRKKKEPQA